MNRLNLLEFKSIELLLNTEVMVANDHFWLVVNEFISRTGVEVLLNVEASVVQELIWFASRWYFVVRNFNS